MNVMRRQFQSLLSTLLLVALPIGPVALAADAPDALAESNALAIDIANYEEQLADLESQFGPYHRSLLEPLQSLSALAQQEGDYERVAQLHNRQLQVMRTVLGFRHPDLVPLLQDVVTNEIRMGNWEAVSDNLEHIRYLVAANNEGDTAAVLEVMRQQAYWHLARVYLDKSELRARNFMEARDLSAEMVKLARAEFGEDSEQLIPWLYESAMNEYRLVELMNADDGIASDTIDRLVRAEGVARLQLYSSNRIGVVNLLGTNNHIPIVDEGELIGEAYLRDAENAVDEIGDIAKKNGDLETQAMALIYAGDLQQVMGRRTSIRKYRDARDMLLESGVSPEKIELFFNRPAIIPFPRIFSRLDEALAFQEQGMQGIETATAGQFHLGQFVAWQKGVPDVPQPGSAPEFLNVDLAYNYVDATLSISSSGKVSAVEVIAAHPEERHVERAAWKALREIQVRPAMVEGRAKRLRDVHIRYAFPAQE